MAEIHLERKRRGAGWLWLLVALVVLAALLWWVWPDAEPEVAFDEAEIEETAPIAPVPVPAEPATEPEPLVVTAIIADPQGWAGRTVSGEAQVAEVPSDRGFWITEGGDRIFAVIDPVGGDAVPDVNPGSTVRLDNAVVRDASFMETMTDLDADTRQAIEGVEMFLVVDGNDVEILETTATE